MNFTAHSKKKMTTSNQKTTNTDNKVTMFHDGDCPLCKYEVKMMQKLDITNAIHWVDITKDKSALDKAGINYQQAMARVHVQDENQNMKTGVYGFLLVWEKLPYYRRIVTVIRVVPFLLFILDKLYTLFAKYRLPLTGKRQLVNLSESSGENK